MVLEQRAQARYEAEKAEYDQKIRQRQAQATGKKPQGRAPKPPVEGPRDKDQYNFTDPDSRIMKNSTDQGFGQHYNAQVAVDHGSLLVLGCRVSDQANDKQEAIPTLDAIPSVVGKPTSASLDNGYFSQDNIEQIEARQVEPYIATGREAHHKSWQAYFAEAPAEPSEAASAKEKMAYKLFGRTGQGDLPVAQMHRRAGAGYYRGGAGVPPVSAAGYGLGRGGVDAGVPGFQPEANASPARWDRCIYSVKAAGVIL